MNDNEYGKDPFYRTDDGKKEMRVSSDESMGDIIGKLKEHAAEGAEPIDQIRVIDEEHGVTEKMIYSDKNQPEKKQTPSSIAFCIAVVAFMAAVVLFMFFAS